MRIRDILKFICQSLVLIVLISCNEIKQEKQEFLRYRNENYLEEKIDTSIVEEVFKYQNYLLREFRETSVKGLNYEAYHLQFYSSHGYGKSIKFEKANDAYSISVKCKTKKYWEECNEYQLELKQDE